MKMQFIWLKLYFIVKFHHTKLVIFDVIVTIQLQELTTKAAKSLLDITRFIKYTQNQLNTFCF